MKEILAVIRQDKMNATKLALAEAGVSSFTARKVLGRGKGNVDYRVLQGAGEGQDAAIAQLGQGPRLIPKRMMTIVVNDEPGFGYAMDMEFLASVRFQHI